MIPDYQRPYAWEDKECQTLWDDIVSFAIPDDDFSKFDRDKNYFLGPIVTFKNEEVHKQEIIDGQQRLTTLMLLLRAFYVRIKDAQDEASKATRDAIGRCLWETDEFGSPDRTALKIDSEVATDNDKEEFLSILCEGQTSSAQNSRYAKNYRFFEAQINAFLLGHASYFTYLPTRILNNCIILPIEANTQDAALRIFSTLNDRGKPLADADIFKAQFYKYYSSINQRDAFINRWKSLEVLCEKVFHPMTGTPMDELFTRYMYVERAKLGNRDTTTEALRKFYERDQYALLKKETTLSNLEMLAEFWKDVLRQNEDRFSDEVLRRLFVLHFAPNSMWTYVVSVYFMQNKLDDRTLEDKAFSEFLTRITAFIWAYAIVHPGVNALRTPMYAEMVNIVNGVRVTFADYQFDTEQVYNLLMNFSFMNSRSITRSMLAWWAFTDSEQKLLSLETPYEVEHISPKNRQEQEHPLQNPANLDILGNKVLLEKRINIRASDYRFVDKVKHYNGFVGRNNQWKQGTEVRELTVLANKRDFAEADMIARNDSMIRTFMGFLRGNGLLK